MEKLKRRAPEPLPTVVCGVQNALGDPNWIAFGFECSNLYFVFALKPQTKEITKRDKKVHDANEWISINI